MSSPPANINQLRRLILDQIFRAFGRPVPGWLRFALTPIFGPVAHRFARLTTQLDLQAGEKDIVHAARWFLPYFVDEIKTYGTENLPPTGPLLIAGNHPGAYDIFAITSCLNRTDLKVVTSNEDLYRCLPNIHPHIIYVPKGVFSRMGAVREMLHHLEGGGTVILFPTGIVDPDPAFLPGAREALQSWSGSVEILLRKATGTRLIVAISSGVLAPKILNNPITRLPKLEWQQRKLSEFIQVFLQLVFGMKFDLTPRVSFSEPFQFTSDSLLGSGESREKEILTQAEKALFDHLEYFANV